MANTAAAVDSDALARARTLLTPAAKVAPTWPALVAAGVFAVTALVFATAMLAEPPLTTEHVAHSAPR
jgi:hypothetical protein